MSKVHKTATGGGIAPQAGQISVNRYPIPCDTTSQMPRYVVLASDYDALAARLKEAEGLLRDARPELGPEVDVTGPAIDAFLQGAK